MDCWNFAPTHLRDVGKVVEAALEALTVVQIALLTIYDLAKADTRQAHGDDRRCSCWKSMAATPGRFVA